MTKRVTKADWVDQADQPRTMTKDDWKAFYLVYRLLGEISAHGKDAILPFATAMVLVHHSYFDYERCAQWLEDEAKSKPLSDTTWHSNATLISVLLRARGNERSFLHRAASEVLRHGWAAVKSGKIDARSPLGDALLGLRDELRPDGASIDWQPDTE